jgi:hypothetical protein
MSYFDAVFAALPANQSSILSFEPAELLLVGLVVLHYLQSVNLLAGFQVAAALDNCLETRGQLLNRVR